MKVFVYSCSTLTALIILSLVSICFAATSSSPSKTESSKVSNVDTTEKTYATKGKEPVKQFDDHESDWQDPFSVLDNYKQKDASFKEVKLTKLSESFDYQEGSSEIKSPLNCPPIPPVENAALPLLRQFNNRFARLFQDFRNKNDAVTEMKEYDVRVKLTHGNLVILERFGQNAMQLGVREVAVHEVHEIMSHMLMYAKEIQETPMDKTISYVQEKFGMPIADVARVLECFLITTVVILLTMRSFVTSSGKSRWIGGCFFIFACGFCWTWYEMYLNELAEKHRGLVDNYGQHCGKGESWSDGILKYFIFRDDKCREYYRFTLVDPLWKVSPSEALSRTITKFFMAPLTDVGTGINKFLTSLLKDLPMTVWPVALLIIFGLPGLLMFMMLGYRVKLFMGLIGIEPAAANRNPVIEMKQIETLQKERDALRKERDELHKENDCLQQKLKTVHQSLELKSSEMSLYRAGGGDASLTGSAAHKQTVEISLHEKSLKSGNTSISGAHGFRSSFSVQDLLPEDSCNGQHSIMSVSSVVQDPLQGSSSNRQLGVSSTSGVQDLLPQCSDNKHQHEKSSSA